MISFQELLREAKESSAREVDRSMDLRVEIRTYGKPSHLWKIALHLARHSKVVFGDSILFMTLGNEELVDTLEDDDGEYWHALDWKPGEAFRPISQAEEEVKTARRRRGVGELGG